MSRKSKAAEFAQDKFNITVTGRHVQITDAMKQYAIDKISRIERFSSRIIDVAVTMDIQKLDHRVDIVVHVEHTTLTSHAATTDMYVSVDQAVDKIEAQLCKYRERVKDHHAPNLGTIDMAVNVLRPAGEYDLIDLNGDIEEESSRRLMEKYRPHKVVSRETMPLKILTYAEALAKMESCNEAFLIFRNEEDLKLKVIYRRKDGDFGVVEPE